MNFDAKLSLILENQSQAGLCPKLWDSERLHEEIRDRLLEIAKDFAEQYEIENIEDITLTGSLANFNWTELSDIDLHLIVDYDKAGADKQLLTDYFKLAKTVWNNEHEIELCGHEVEVYVQDANEEHYSSGVYSLTNNEWIVEPRKQPDSKPDQREIDDKAESYITEIENLKIWTEEGDITDLIRDLKEKIKTMRKSGLMQGGEYSLENLVFKKLRNDGHLAKLNQLSKDAYNSKMSLDQCPTD